MILVDYSQVALSAILTFQRELKGNEAEVKNLITPRYTFYTEVA